jgi:hypothetical protein
MSFALRGCQAAPNTIWDQYTGGKQCDFTFINACFGVFSKMLIIK